MRRYEIDWVRNISILMLFVYHTSAIFCVFGDFYIISSEKNVLANILIVLMFIWYMPTLFFLAGASTYFSTKKRNFKEYFIERVKKLFIPLVFGILVLVPPQTYLARVWRGESNLKYSEHLKYFFTNLTDFTGYDGAFSPAHLWFILYLFIVSMVGGFIVFKVFKSDKGERNIEITKSIFFHKYSVLILLVTGVISDIFPSIMGKSIIGCLVIFIFGYIVYSDKLLVDRIVLNRFKFLILLLTVAIIGVLYTFKLKDFMPIYSIWILDSVLKNIVLISAVSSIVGFASLYLNKTNNLLKYLNSSSFAIYILHQPILLGVAYIIIPLVKSTLLAMVLIILCSSILTFLLFELVKKIKFLKIFLGIKN